MGEPDRLQRLWAPHRMAYITGEDGTGRTDDGGCPFCRIPTLDDRDGLVLARGETVYAVLNLHPYNPGHLMVVPYRHVAGLDELTDAGVARAGRLHPHGGRRASRAASSPHGFNVGLNLGRVAGGSLADHLHQHVVPRWGGDANFITVLAGTKVIPAAARRDPRPGRAAWPRRLSTRSLGSPGDLDRPTHDVLYDGTCGFCTRGVELAVDRLPRSRDTDWQPYQAVDLATYGVSTAEAERTLHLVEASGRIWHGAGAVGRLLVLSGGAVAVLGRVLLAPPVSWLAEAAYRVATLLRHRPARAARRRWPACPRTARAPAHRSSRPTPPAAGAASVLGVPPPGASARAGVGIGSCRR